MYNRKYVTESHSYHLAAGLKKKKKKKRHSKTKAKNKSR